jgi:hypothetical protein
MEVFDIAVIPSMSEDERNKLIRQAADTGLIIFLKQFIPFFLFRYWGTRIYIGSLVWYFLLYSFALTVSSQATEKQMQCQNFDDSCNAQVAGLQIMAGLTFLAPMIVFGVYSGSSSKRARQRLNIDRKTALAIIAIPNTSKSL